MEDDANLKIEAFVVEEGKDESEADKVGEAQVDLFPRADPKPNVYAGFDEPIYTKDNVGTCAQLIYL